MTNIAGEKRYDQVFGETFALYTQKEMLEFIEPFKVRFDKNGLDARKIFSGKTCFDAACGNGRGALFMLMNGAKYVTCCDFSDKNVETTRANFAKFGFSNAEVFHSSLERIARPAESFDFVWCNGVLMHTTHPNRCLNEIARLLKQGGQSWIYVYGSGGAYWRSVQHFRRMLKDVAVRDCIATLQLLRYETRYVAEFIDDWFATHLRSYTHADFGRALVAAGFAPTQPLPYGMPYDTSHRRYTFGPAEKDAMGEGDLRYLLDKVKPTPKKEAAILDESEYGSSFEWPAAITQGVDAAMARLKVACPQKWQRVAAAAHIQRDLRLQMTESQAFELRRYLALIEQVTAYAAGTASL